MEKFNPQTGKKLDEKEDEPRLITKFNVNGKNYELYTNGNLYERTSKGEISILDKLNDENKKIIEKIMSRCKSGFSDVVDYSEKFNKTKEDEEKEK